MRHRLRHLRSILFAFAALGAVAATTYFPASAFGQMSPGTGLKIQNEAERQVFASVLCMCGCPRESLSSCTCGSADAYRNELRGMMAQGITPEQIKAEWVKRFGPQSLSVPPNTGANRLLYVMPLAAIVGMAAIVIIALRKFRGGGPPDPPPAVAGAPVDEYDEKLNEELKQLDKE